MADFKPQELLVTEQSGMVKAVESRKDSLAAILTKFGVEEDSLIELWLPWEKVRILMDSDLSERGILGIMCLTSRLLNVY